jgi:hypothetical protein
MGQEITNTDFTETDEVVFRKKLREETKILKRWFDDRIFDDSTPKCGLELEAWLVTKDFVPEPIGDLFIRTLDHPLVVPEISKFNFELNTDPFPIEGSVFSTLEEKLFNLWKKCEDQAENMGLRALMIGTLPTLRDHMLNMDCLSPQKRYFALNERVMKLREGLPIKLDIEGKDRVHFEHNHVMTECAATSLQIHFGVTQDNAPKYYNASIVSSAFVAALCANSPYFYGKELWDETRIPIFEQSVNIKSFRKSDGEYATRVSLGNGYVHNTILELFIENLDGYSILLPDPMDTDPEWLDHLRLQNGTIWRWNRPLVGLSDSGRPSLRLEFRVPSAGPTVRDAIANMIFQIALVEYLKGVENLEERLPFVTAKKNFYNACKKSLDAEVTWIDGKTHNIQQLLLNEILPKAEKAILNLGIDQSEVQKYLEDIIKQRLTGGQNGANWQKAFVQTHGPRFQEMLEMYYEYQRQNIPVHLWNV